MLLDARVDGSKTRRDTRICDFKEQRLVASVAAQLPGCAERLRGLTSGSRPPVERRSGIAAALRLVGARTSYEMRVTGKLAGKAAGRLTCEKLTAVDGSRSARAHEPSATKSAHAPVKPRSWRSP